LAAMPDSIKILALSAPRFGERWTLKLQVLNLIPELAVPDCNTWERSVVLKPDTIVV